METYWYFHPNSRGIEYLGTDERRAERQATFYPKCIVFAAYLDFEKGL